jgi:malate dehydrogenase
VPVKLGSAGVEKILELKMTEEERAALTKSAGAVKELVVLMQPKLAEAHAVGV